MIDIDKYEEHNTDDRIWYQYSEGLTSDYTDGRSRADEADARLVADAPKLLAEVKRLRKRLEAFDCIRFDIEHAIDHSWASWEDLKVFLKEMIE
tara:strand:- start:42 stop:323 length:282 start_codon:yes stop_codon:yes gene_type:complete